MARVIEGDLVSVDSHKKNNPYYVGYLMLTKCLETDSFYEGMSTSLELAQDYMKSDSIMILRKDKDGRYRLFDKAFGQNRLKGRILEKTINKKSDYFADNKYTDTSFNEGCVKRITTLHIKDDDDEYLLAVLNNRIKCVSDNMEFMGILKKVTNDLIRKYTRLEELRNASEIDALTSLYNRMAYRRREEELNNDTERPVTFALIDLFRLKYTNDNVNHAAGDQYISMTASLLRDAFRKKQAPIPHDDIVYRVGGDEFILISETKSQEEVEEILRQVGEQVELFEFSKTQEVPTGINYGVIERKNGEPIEKLYVLADKKLTDDKTKTYQKLGIDRRK